MSLQRTKSYESARKHHRERHKDRKRDKLQREKAWADRKPHLKERPE